MMSSKCDKFKQFTTCSMFKSIHYYRIERKKIISITATNIKQFTICDNKLGNIDSTQKKKKLGNIEYKFSLQQIPSYN